MTYALVFSGQGAQHPGMLPWLVRDDTIARMEHELGGDWRERLADPSTACENRRAQVLLTGIACAAWAQLQPYLPAPAIIAGYSVGELPAFSAAGVFDAATALQLSLARAACMDAAVDGIETGLLGVTGATPDGIAALCAGHGLEVAIRIDAGNAVLGGRRERLRDAQADGHARGWRCTELNVALASHTHWLGDAVDCFDEVLAGVPFSRPWCALASNVGIPVRTSVEARAALTRQIATTVRWDSCLDRIAAQRVSAVLEIGPGQSLSRMWNDRHPDVAARSVDEFRSASAVVAWVRNRLA